MPETYSPAGVFIHDGQGRRLAELPLAVGKRAYRTMQVSRAMYVIPETDEHLELCDPREGRYIVIQSPIYPTVWAGPITALEGGPVQGTVQIEARSFEGVLQERYLPSGFSVDGSAGAVFTAAWRAVEAENPTGVVLSENLSAGQPFDGTNYGDRSLYDTWNLIAQQTGHEWWLEHEVVEGQLLTVAHFRPARGQDNTATVTIGTGPNANARVNRWRVSADGAQHRIRAIAGATSSLSAFSDRSRVERRLGLAPVSTAALITSGNSRHGYDFGKWPTGDSVLTRAERIAVVENVRGEGALAVAAEALLRQGRTAERAVDIEVQAHADLWRFCTPGDIVWLELPVPYMIDGYSGPVAIIDTEVTEELGTMRLNIEVPNG